MEFDQLAFKVVAIVWGAPTTSQMKNSLNFALFEGGISRTLLLLAGERHQLVTITLDGRPG